MSQYIYNTVPSSNPLNTNVRDPVQLTFAARDPNAQDNVYPLASEWQNTVNGNIWQLISISFNNVTRHADANWRLTSTSTTAGILTLTGDSGGAVPPSVSGNVNLIGTSGQITVTGTPGTNTLQLALTGGGTAADSFQVDTNTPPGTNPVLPTAAGLVNVKGQTVPNTSGIQVQSNAANEIDITMFSPFKGNFGFTDVSSGGTETVFVENTSNTASSNADFSAIAGGTSGGDPYYHLVIPATTFYALGIDNSDSDKLKLNYDVSPVSPSSGTNLMTVTTLGAMTRPKQPAFLVVLSTSTAGGVTGAGGVYTLGTQGAGVVTTVYDQASNITTPAGVTTFTAPVDGIYQFTVQYYMSPLTAAMTALFVVLLKNGAPLSIHSTLNPGVIRNPTDTDSLQVQFTFNALLAATNTITTNMHVDNGGGNTCNILGSGTVPAYTYFTGYLIA